MGLADRLAEIEREVKTTTACPVGRLIASLDTATAELLAKVLDLPNKVRSNSQLRLDLAAEGHRFSRDTIGQHRQQRCACYYGAAK